VDLRTVPRDCLERGSLQLRFRTVSCASSIHHVSYPQSYLDRFDAIVVTCVIETNRLESESSGFRTPDQFRSIGKLKLSHLRAALRDCLERGFIRPFRNHLLYSVLYGHVAFSIVYPGDDPLLGADLKKLRHLIWR